MTIRKATVVMSGSHTYLITEDQVPLSNKINAVNSDGDAAVLDSRSIEQMALISVQELDQLLFLSFRYALGRRTYVVSDVARYIMKNKEQFAVSTIQRICSEIDQMGKEKLGDPCDVSVWLSVRASLGQFLMDKKSLGS